MQFHITNLKSFSDKGLARTPATSGQECGSRSKDTKNKALATEAELSERRNYGCMMWQFLLEPITLKLTRVYGKTITQIVREIGNILVKARGDSQESEWFQQ